MFVVSAGAAIGLFAYSKPLRLTGLTLRANCRPLLFSESGTTALAFGNIYRLGRFRRLTPQRTHRA